MYETEQTTNSSGGYGFAIGVLVGAMAGAGLALLFAPKPGAQLRGELGDTMNAWRDTATKKVREVADRAGSQLNDLSSAANRAKNTATSAARDMADGASDASRSRM